MDRISVSEPVDIGQGLANTVVVLRAKAKSKSVGLRINAEQGLPAVNGFGGELNQVWSNLLENALDAVDEGGVVELAANRENDTVVVRVIDNGPGNSGGNPKPYLRSVFYDKARWQRHRAGPGYRAAPRAAAQWRD
jgi:signal transduction histidine kinase